jgi:hypothetical protein
VAPELLPDDSLLSRVRELRAPLQMARHLVWGAALRALTRAVGEDGFDDLAATGR